LTRDKKRKEKKSNVIFWLLAGTYYRNLEDYAIFFTKILCMCRNHIFQVEKMQIFATKKTNALVCTKPCTIKEEDEHQK
jgi:hypothetical protein